MRYVQDFPVKLHHPKESDLLFPRVARAALDLNNEPQLKKYVDLPLMAQTAAEMLQSALDAQTNRIGWSAPVRGSRATRSRFSPWTPRSLRDT